MTKEGPPVGEARKAAEEAKLARVIQGKQPAQEHTPEQLAEHTHRQEERGSAR